MAAEETVLTISIQIDGKPVLDVSPLSLIAQAALQSDMHFLPAAGSVITCRISNSEESLALSAAVQQEAPPA